MPSLGEYAFARPIIVVPGSAVESDAPGNGARDQLLTDSVGAPVYPEVFASVAARDAALGAYGPYTIFTPTSWAEAEAAGFTATDLAVGHDLAKPGFDRVAQTVLDAVAENIESDLGPTVVVIARVRYEIDRDGNGEIGVSACGDFGVNAHPDNPQAEVTMRWLEGEFSQFSRRLSATGTASVAVHYCARLVARHGQLPMRNVIDSKWSRCESRR